MKLAFVREDKDFRTNINIENHASKEAYCQELGYDPDAVLDFFTGPHPGEHRDGIKALVALVEVSDEIAQALEYFMSQSYTLGYSRRGHALEEAIAKTFDQWVADTAQTDRGAASMNLSHALPQIVTDLRRALGLPAGEKKK